VRRRTAITIGAVAIVAVLAFAAISLNILRTKNSLSLTWQKLTGPSIGAGSTQGGKASLAILVNIPKN
jgi:hypothetical protein